MCIIDDREDVWQGCGNLVQVKPYHFFRHTGDINAPPGLEKGNSPRLAESASKLCINDSQDKDSKNGVSESLNEIEQLSPNEVAKETDSKENEETEKTEAKETENEDTKANTKENAVSNTQSDTTNENDETRKEVAEVVAPIKTEKESKQDLSKPENNIVDEDDDDYLLYLEDILRRIHTEFYATLDQGNGRKSLRNIIPRVRSQVLKSLCLTFSGLIPNHQKLHQSRAYKVARAFGAEVTQVKTLFFTLYFSNSLSISLLHLHNQNRKLLSGLDGEDYALGRYQEGHGESERGQKRRQH